MAKNKHTEPVAPVASEAKVEIKGSVKILSQRLGDIVVKVDGKHVTIKYNAVVDLPEAIAAKLEKMHPGQIRVL